MAKKDDGDGLLEKARKGFLGHRKRHEDLMKMLNKEVGTKKKKPKPKK